MVQPVTLETNEEFVAVNVAPPVALMSCRIRLLHVMLPLVLLMVACVPAVFEIIFTLPSEQVLGMVTMAPLITCIVLAVSVTILLGLFRISVSNVFEPSIDTSPPLNSVLLKVFA